MKIEIPEVKLTEKHWSGDIVLTDLGEELVDLLRNLLGKHHIPTSERIITNRLNLRADDWSDD